MISNCNWQLQSAKSDVSPDGAAAPCSKSTARYLILIEIGNCDSVATQWEKCKNKVALQLRPISVS